MYLNRKTIIVTLTVGIAFVNNLLSFVDATETTKLILASVEEDKVPDKWFVGLKEETGVIEDTSGYQKNLKGDFVRSKAQLSDLASAYGGKLERTFVNAVYGMEVTMDEKTAASMAENPNVEYVEQVAIFRKSQQSPATWGIDRIDQRNLPLDNTYNPGANDGTGVTAYIIDTGVQITHDEFKNASGQSRAIWGTNTADNKDKDCDGHGTHVAGTVGGLKYGVAKNVNIVAVKVLDCDGSGFTTDIIDGVEWVMNHAARNGLSDKAVANMSLGGGVSQSFNKAAKNLHNSGVLTAVAAGNSDEDACRSSPASEPVVITVGATDSTDTRSWFSNHGSCLDIFAPGSSITAAHIGSDSATDEKSGTSMASPHVAGALALAISGNSPDAEADLFNAATPDKVLNPKRNSPNLLLYVSNINSGPVPSNSPSISPAPSVLASPVPSVFPSKSPSPTIMPTEMPSGSPTTNVVTCVDSTLLFTAGNVSQDCAWVSLNKDQVCGINGVSSSCPSACDACQVCEDSPFKFTIVRPNRTLVKSCDWVKLDSSTRCEFDGVAEACRSTCALC